MQLYSNNGSFPVCQAAFSIPTETWIIYKVQGFHFVFEQQMNQESQQMAGGPRISAFEWASGACTFTYFCIHFYMHNSIIMCQRDNHPDSTKNYKKIQVHVHQDVLNK